MTDPKTAAGMDPVGQQILAETANTKSLKKNLSLLDVYAMSTGAMFSSGLFLLPGIAASYTGDSIYLAYLCAGFLILPAMYCMAELSTAMPKAGGTYYFLDRAMGPLMGTIGGLGSWIAVVFKSAFALVGMGAYLSLYLDLPFTALAIGLTLVFGALNVFSAKETTFLQRILVATLVVILLAFIAVGLQQTTGADILHPNHETSTFIASGVVGFISTIGLVFVSYAGLTKVASVAEEIEDPDRNIPLGMTLSLLTATIIYTLGTLILINILPANELHGSLTPVADAGREMLGWVPFDLGVILIVVAAIAAFASTGNAGIMSASRYPFAMAKDGLVPGSLSKLGKHSTPTNAIVFTVFAMIAVLVIFDVEAVAKLASAFQLLLFGLVCLAVIVMRESRIMSYKPGFRAPLYPWLQIAGIGIAMWLIFEMGALAIAFTGAMIVICVAWYRHYAMGKIDRRGAIFHVHQRLGEQKYEGLERELMTIIHDRTQAENLSYEALVTRSAVLDLKYGKYDNAHLSLLLSGTASNSFDLDDETIVEALFETPWTYRPVTSGVFLVFKSHPALSQPELITCRFGPSADLGVPEIEGAHTIFYLIVPSQPVGLDLRLAGHIAEVVQSTSFGARWGATFDPQELKSILMRDDHFYHGAIEDVPLLASYIGRSISFVDLPGSCLLALIERDGEVHTATADVVLQPGDTVAIIGEPNDIEVLLDSSAIKLVQVA